MSRILKNYNNQVTRAYGNGHNGIDIVGYAGKVDYIVAHTSGTVEVIATGYKNAKGSTGNASWGNRVMIKHEGGYYTQYCHLETVNVSKGQKVTKGQVIGKMGNTGNSYGTHLHFEVYKGGTAGSYRINPTAYINADLPNNPTTSKTGVTGEIKYKGYAHSKSKGRDVWLGEVSSHNTSAYAGNKGYNLTGIKAVPKNGEIFIETHIKGGSWLGKISSKKYNNTDSYSYSGVLGTPIDLVKITCTNGSVEYRVYDNVKGCFLPWVKNGAEAGNKGHSIGAIQIR